MGLKHNPGITASEKYLARLCDATFLSLWSYPNIYRDHPKFGSREICDLLISCGDDLIIFSDKSCAFPNSGDINRDWCRWYRRSVEASARQLKGGERWLREHPDRVFVDRECTQRLPTPFRIGAQTRIHRVVVAIGAANRCRQQLGGSGSLVLLPSIHDGTHSDPNDSQYAPFCIGIVDSTQPPIHVFDEVTLDVILRELDTITDFTEYLRKKERLITSGRLGHVLGEENLLAHYLMHMNAEEEHDFIVPAGATQLAIEDGLFQRYIDGAQYRAKKKADYASYLWDRIIDEFGRHALDGTLVQGPASPIGDTERALRFMAREPRLVRRMHAAAMLEFLGDARTDLISTRVILSPTMTGTAYVFQLVPQKNLEWQEYRQYREGYLSKYCFALAGKYKELAQVIGIGTEPGLDNGGRSYDLVCIKIDEWTPELAREADEIREEAGLLKHDRIQRQHRHVDEYPLVPREPPVTWPYKIGRNEPCPCRSGLKYKRCCGRPRASPYTAS